MVTQIESPTAGVPADLVAAAMPRWRQRRRAELAAFHQPKPRPEPLPEPEVRAVVVATKDERVPRAARSFAATAERAGWETEITYARGPQITPGGYCIACGAFAQGKKDGDLYKHNTGNRDESGALIPCDSITRDGNRLTRKIVDSILVSCTRGAGDARVWVRAQWLNGKADECGYTINGRGTLMTVSEGKRLLTSADHSEVSA